MFEVVKLLTKEVSHHAKEKIDSKLKSIKSVIDWSTFDLEICNQINLVDLYKYNQFNESLLWNNIAKLSIDLYLDYDFYKDFIFLNKHKGPDYDYRLRMLGYEEENGYWISRRKPEKDLVIEYVFISCLYQSIGKRLTMDQQRSRELSNTVELCDRSGISNGGISIINCPFCESGSLILGRGCRRCEATEEEIIVYFRQESEAQVAVLNQMPNDMLSDLPNRDANFVLDSCQSRTVMAPFDDMLSISLDDPTSRSDFLEVAKPIDDYPIRSKIKQTTTNDKLDENGRSQTTGTEENHFHTYNCEVPATDISNNCPSLASILDCGTEFPWICSQCEQINDDDTRDQCNYCNGPRYPPVTGATTVSDNLIGEFDQYSITSELHDDNAPHSAPSSFPGNSNSNKELWTCKLCHVDNLMSSRQCVACGRSKLCQQCETREVIIDDFCVDCLDQKWCCWHGYCKSINFGLNKEYCDKCGVARQAPDLSGQAIWRSNDGTLQLVWVCDRCQQINDNCSNVCSDNLCQAPRNTRFMWCKVCGWGTPADWTDLSSKTCNQCSNIL